MVAHTASLTPVFWDLMPSSDSDFCMHVIQKLLQSCMKADRQTHMYTGTHILQSEQNTQYSMYVI